MKAASKGKKNTAEKGKFYLLNTFLLSNLVPALS